MQSDTVLYREPQFILTSEQISSWDRHAQTVREQRPCCSRYRDDINLCLGCFDAIRALCATEGAA
jgi:hypothetical protein